MIVNCLLFLKHVLHKIAQHISIVAGKFLQIPLKIRQVMKRAKSPKHLMATLMASASFILFFLNKIDIDVKKQLF